MPHSYNLAFPKMSLAILSKNGKMTLSFVFSLLAVFANNAVRAAPMQNDLNHNHQQPRFGEVFPEHLVAPIPDVSHLGHQGYSMNSATNVGLDNYNSHQDTSFALPLPFESQGHYYYNSPIDYGTTQPHHSGIVWNQDSIGQQDLQNFDHLMNTDYSHNFQSDNSYISNYINDDNTYNLHTLHPHFANDQEGHHIPQNVPGQDHGSSNTQQDLFPTHLPPTFSGSSLPLPSTSSPLNRPRLPLSELNSRPGKLNWWDWQTRYTKDQLMIIYSHIAHKWGNQNRVVLIRSLFARLNDHFAKFPGNREAVLAGDKDAITRVAGVCGVHHNKGFLHKQPEIMTPEEFLAWILTPPQRKFVPPGDEYARPDWMSPRVWDPRTVLRIYKYLQEAWQASKQQVDIILQDMTEAEVEPYLTPLMGRSSNRAKEAANQLFMDIQRKHQQLQAAIVQGEGQNGSSTLAG